MSEVQRSGRGGETMEHDHAHPSSRATFLSTGAGVRIAMTSGPILLLWLAVWWALA